MIRFGLFFLIVVTAITALIAQSTIKIAGTVYDAETGMPLPGAQIVVLGSQNGNSSDAFGMFVLEDLLVGRYDLEISYIGYKRKIIYEVPVTESSTTRLQIELQPEIGQIDAIEVLGNAQHNLSSANIAVLDRLEIQRNGGNSLQSILKQQAGVEIQSAGVTGGPLRVSIRGSDVNQVLVLLDGVPLNDGFSGGADLSLIPLDIIERIEIYKGGQGARFGNGAIGGAINIITRKRAQRELRGTFAGGSFGLLDGRVSAGRQSGRFEADIAINGRRAQNNYAYAYRDNQDKSTTAVRRNADFNESGIFVKTGWMNRTHRIILSGWYQQSERGLPGKIQRWSDYARAKLERVSGRLVWVSGGEKWNVQNELSYADQNNHNVNAFPPDAPLDRRGYGAFNYRYRLQTGNFNSSANIDWADWLQSAFKINWREQAFENHDIQYANYLDARDLNFGLGTHQRVILTAPGLHSRLIWMPLLRYDVIRMRGQSRIRNEKFWSPGSAFELRLGEQNYLELDGNLTNSFRMPTFSDLFFQEVRVQGRPDLRPEKSTNLDLSLSAKLDYWMGVKAGATWFRYDITDLIVWRLGSFDTFSPFNTDALISGYEYNLQLSGLENLLTVELNFTNQKPLNKAPGETTFNKIIPYRARHIFKGNLAVNWEKLRLNCHFRYTGPRYLTETNSKRLPAFQVWDASVGWQQDIAALETELNFSMDNLFAEQYQIVRDYPQPGRSFRMAVQIKL